MLRGMQHTKPSFIFWFFQRFVTSQKMKKSSTNNVKINMPDHDNGPCFFKIMQLNGNDSHSLRIPPHFVTTCMPRKIPKKAVLKGPSGGRWRVSILPEGKGEASLQQGWQQFYQHHSLGDGEFLVFRHTGKMCFDVEIYDKSGCKRANVSTTPTHRDSSTTTAEDINEEEKEIEIMEISETETEPLVQTKSKGKRVAEKGNGTGYELREQRIKENKKMTQKLGILKLSQNLNLKHKHKPPLRKIPTTDEKTQNPLPFSQPSSSRSLPPVNYVEKGKWKSSGAGGDEPDVAEIHIQEGSKPEIYTQEQEMLLGDCQMSWTLLDDGKRIRDPVNGEPCHQCRQKTLGLHTHCSKCKLARGQLCGDCLYIRYGENVIEANQNPNWICPVCREICNCSLCRQKKGWRPTGPIYREVKKLGFKSVAHYLIKTYQAKPSEDAGSPL